jgi:hypothetical protein
MNYNLTQITRYGLEVKRQSPIKYELLRINYIEYMILEKKLYT